MPAVDGISPLARLAAIREVREDTGSLWIDLWVTHWLVLAALCFGLGVVWYVVTMVVAMPHAQGGPGSELSWWERRGCSPEQAVIPCGVGPNAEAVLSEGRVAQHVRRRLALKFRPSTVLAWAMFLIGAAQFLLTAATNWAGGLGWSLLATGVFAGSLATLAAGAVAEDHAWRTRASQEWRFALAFAAVDWKLVDSEPRRREIAVAGLNRLHQQLIWSNATRYPSDAMARDMWNASLVRLGEDIALIQIGGRAATRAACMAWVERACRLLRTGDCRRWHLGASRKVTATARRFTRKNLAGAVAGWALGVSIGCIAVGLLIVRSHVSVIDVAWFDPHIGILGVVGLVFGSGIPLWNLVESRRRERTGR